MRDIPGDDKTEKATPKRREDERKKGNIFQSRDITSALGLIGGYWFLYAAGSTVFAYFQKLVRQYLTGFSDITDISTATANHFMRDFVLQSALLSLPFLIVAALLGFAFNVAQTRMNFSMKRLKPDFTKIDPIRGMKKIITMRSLVELLKSAVKIAITAVVLYTEIKARLPQILGLFDMELFSAGLWLCGSLFAIVMKIGMIMIAFGALDYFYQWWEYEKQLRMSKQEIKDEYKQTEGDPKIKGRIREQQKKMSMMRIMQQVPLADVVIRNPTHFAVAIKYDAKRDRAPVVVAKGQDYLALKIIEVAQTNKVSITENPPLARALYAAVKIGQEIPEEHYQAVAEVLAFVFNLRKGGRRI